MTVFSSSKSQKKFMMPTPDAAKVRNMLREYVLQFANKLNCVPLDVGYGKWVTPSSTRCDHSMVQYCRHLEPCGVGWVQHGGITGQTNDPGTRYVCT